MKTLGLLGGMSWESTVTYYRLINQRIGRRLGGLHSAELLLYSVDFEPIEQLQHAGDWDAAAHQLIAAARSIERAGAEGLMICTNTMHKVYEAVDDAISIPMLHIADATAEAIQAANHHTVGLLGTAFTMEQTFYRGRLSERHGLDVLVPNDDDRAIVHQVIYDELCHGQICNASRQHYTRVISDLAERGAEAVILGCTEISLLVGPDDASIPVFDTTAIHAMQAADWMLD